METKTLERKQYERPTYQKALRITSIIGEWEKIQNEKWNGKMKKVNIKNKLPQQITKTIKKRQDTAYHNAKNRRQSNYFRKGKSQSIA